MGKTCWIDQSRRNASWERKVADERATGHRTGTRALYTRRRKKLKTFTLCTCVVRAPIYVNSINRLYTVGGNVELHDFTDPM